MGKGKKSQTVGYAYFLGLAYALCSKVDKLLEFRMDETTTAKPNLIGSGSFVARTGKSQQPGGSGNSTSTVKFYDGNQRVADEYITSKTGEEIAYRNTAYLVVNGFIGDNVRAAPNYSCVVERTKITSWSGSGISDNINGDVNPASVLWYMLTTMMKLDMASLDESSFINANKTLVSEGFGVSFVMSRAQEAKEWVKEILRTIDGVICINPKSGKLTLRLLRDDYDKKNLKLLNESNTANIKIKRKSWDDTFSRVTVKYTQRGSFKEASVSGVNSATSNTLKAEKATEVEYMSVTSTRNANIVLNRLMRKLTYPLAELKFSLSSAQFNDIMVGDVMLFSNTKLGIIDMPIRVLNLGGDKEDSQTVDVEACEDVFALDNVNITSVQEDLYKPVDLNVGELEYYGAVEATAEMGETLGVLPFYVKPSGFVQGTNIKDGLSGVSVNAPSWTLGELKENLEISDEMGDELSFLVKEITPLWQVAGTRAGWQRIKFTCLIDSEFINFQYRDDLGDGVFRVRALMRGLSGTKITRHLKGAKVWFAPVDANDLITLPLIAPNTTLYFQSHNFAMNNEAKSVSFSHSGKSKKPYPPSNLFATRDANRVTLGWRNCVRLHGANYRNADNLIAGEDEGLNENRVIIKWMDNGVEKTHETTGESFELLVGANTTFRLYQLAYEGGYLSDEVSITI